MARSNAASRIRSKVNDRFSFVSRTECPSASDLAEAKGRRTWPPSEAIMFRSRFARRREFVSEALQPSEVGCLCRRLSPTFQMVSHALFDRFGLRQRSCSRRLGSSSDCSSCAGLLEARQASQRHLARSFLSRLLPAQQAAATARKKGPALLFDSPDATLSFSGAFWSRQSLPGLSFCS